MTKIQILRKIESNREMLKKNGVLKIGIFGSILKNKQTKNSDIDLLVKFDSSNFDKYAESLILLERIFNRKIDLVIESSLRPELNYIKEEAEYARL